MKTVATSAVEAINEQNSNNAQAKAILLIKDIVNLQDTIKSNETDIDSLQKRLSDMSESEMTVASVTGKGGLVPQNETQKTIAKAIETLVKSKQGCVEQRANDLGTQIIARKSSIEQLEKLIAKKQDELNVIQVDVVIEADVLE